MLSSSLTLAALALFGLSSSVSSLVIPGVNLGAGDSIASLFLTAIDFVDPASVLQNARNPELAYNLGLLRMIADESMRLGPYTVTNVSLPYGLPPNNDTHSYFSWAPYWWPEDTCAFLNTTEYLTKCKYVQRDGEFNPDLFYIRQKPAFINLAADSVSLALAAEAFGEWSYLAHAAMELRYFFLNDQTYMRPNFEFTQVRRGTNNKPVGVKSGVLDARWLMYVTTTLNILNAHIDEILPGQTEAVWTTADYQGMQTWMTNMTTWMMTATIAKDAGKTTNNHATWYFAQASTYAYFGGNNTEAGRILQQFLTGIYQTFFSADGGQPKELERTRPFHYSVFNLEPMLCMAKLGDKVGVDVWGWPSLAGNNTIQKAVDYLLGSGFMGEDPSDLLQHVYAVRGRYGDPTGKYAYWIANFTAGMENPPIYPLWAYPLYTPPTSNATLPTANAAGWIGAPALISITATDSSKSGVRTLIIMKNNETIESRLSSAAPTQTGTIVMPDGAYTLTWCSRNDQGDLEICTNNSAVVKVDATAPLITLTDVAHPDFVYEPTDNIRITCLASDATSGLVSQNCSDVSASASTYPLYPTVTPVTAVAVDKAGNVALVTVNIVVRMNLNSLCAKTLEFITPFNQPAAKSMCGQLESSLLAATADLRNMILDAYIVQAQICRLNGATMEHVDYLVAGAKSLKH